jgi:transcriptional regulator with XRE-family HTH domain
MEPKAAAQVVQDIEGVYQTLGQRLREIRQRHGWTQRQLAERVGCSYDMLRSIELGRARPSLRMLGQILAELGK